MDDPDHLPPGEPPRGARIRSAAELIALLRDRDEFEALTLLAEGDPLGLTDRAVTWLDRNGFLLDPHALVQKTLMVLVERGPELRENDGLGKWIARAMDGARWTLLRNDDERHAREGAPREPLEPRFRFLARGLGLAAGDMLAATIALNGLPDRARRAAYGLILRGESFGTFAEREGMSPRKAKDLLVRAIAHLIDVAEGRAGGEDHA